MSRSLVGSVQDGHARPPSSYGIYDFARAGDHATGRSQAMADSLLHVAWLRSVGLTPPHAVAASFTGARFQDIRGTRTHVAAHRAVLSVTLLNRNLADFAMNPLRPRLRSLLIAPQARTDLLPPPANCADRLFEIVAAKPTMEIVQWVVHRQPPGGPLQSAAVIDAIHRLLACYQRCYDQAIEKSQSILENRGFRQVEILGLLRNAGPRSAISDERMENLNFSLQEGGPSQFGELPQIFLAICKDHARHVLPALSNSQAIENARGELDEAMADVVPGT